MNPLNSNLKKFDKKTLSTEIYFSNQISITSLTGCGSSTTLNMLKERLKNFPYRFVSGGFIMRSIASSFRSEEFPNGMTIEQFAKYNREHPEDQFDLKCDQMLSQFAEQNWSIIEGRLPHIMAPHSFRVLLNCDATIRAERRRAQKYPEMSVEEVLQLIEKRDNDDNARYEKLYPGCLWPDSDYDLVIDTGKFSPDQVVEKIIDEHTKWANENTTNRAIY